ncbi:GerAB/ArcD/ProY family transporter [Paenibacillus sp. UNC451MF]|uniref:GerAB/ArcD/ProY family transporter n=1 Tax=Paenibacillus sp. UNC451MF TaxID=1449063 RepID=UPI00048B9DAA|nr:endospore germination permease [Paenibacillus sp. UNC451MF]
MKKYAFNEITSLQFVLILFGTQVSFGLLSLPQELAEHAGTDSWISLLLGWLCSIVASLMMVRIMQSYPDGTLFDLLQSFIGKWASIAAVLFFSFWTFSYGYIGIVRIVLYTKVWLLPQTPSYIIMLILLVPAYYIARNGLRVLGRYVELVFFMSLWIPFAYLLPLKETHYLNLLPVMKEGWEPIFSALRNTFLSFSGTEIVFILYPFLQKKQHASVGIVISNTMTLLVFLLITLICLMYYGPDEIKEYNEPVINVLKTIEFKFVERIEVLFISFYLLFFSLSWISTMYMTVFSTSWLLGLKDHRGHLRVLCILLGISALIFIPGFNQSDQLEKYMSFYAMAIDYALPLGLLVYLAVHRRFQWRKSG